MIDYLAVFIFSFAVIDPIGTVPVFIAATRGFSDQEKRSTAIKAVLAAGIVLLFFIVAGEPILDAINIPLAAFQIAGGIVLFLFALSMIFGDSKPETEIKSINNTTETAIFPLAMPSIASPGAMLAAVLLTENATHGLADQIQTTVVIAAVLAIVFILLILASKVHGIIGDAGASIISRVMGLILTAVAVSNIIDGIKLSFSI